MAENVFSDPESLNLTQMRVILAVVRSGGMTQAAEALGYLNASSVAYHIDRIERQLGVHLFVRRGRKLQPTQLTETICATADRVCALVDQLHTNVEFQLRGESGRLRLGCSTMTLSCAEKLNGYLREHHNAIRTEVRQFWCSREVTDALAAREIDMGLSCLEEDSSTDLPVILCSERLMAVVGSSHRLSSRRAIDIQELSGDVIIICDSGPDGQTLIGALGRYESVVIKNVVGVATLSAALEYVRAGRGVAILPESTVTSNSLSMLAHSLLGNGDYVQRRVAILVSPDCAAQPVVKRVVEIAQRVL